MYCVYFSSLGHNERASSGHLAMIGPSKGSKRAREREREKSSLSLTSSFTWLWHLLPSWLSLYVCLMKQMMRLMVTRLKKYSQLIGREKCVRVSLMRDIAERREESSDALEWENRTIFHSNSVIEGFRWSIEIRVWQVTCLSTAKSNIK